MPCIPTRAHGVIDYAVGSALLAAPELIGFADDGSAATFTRSMGAAAIAYSLVTDYELGAVKLLPMKVHLGIDLGWATALASVPWLAGFARRGIRSWLPHALVATAAVLIVANSETAPR